MRTKAQEREMSMSPSSSSFSLTTYPSCLLDTALVDGMSCGDTHDVNVSSWITSSALESTDGFPMDQIWREMETPLQVPASLPQGIHQAEEKTCSSVPISCSPAITAMWDDDQCPEVFWNMDAEEIRMLAPHFDCGES
jgi:myb proto-oncogene protein